MENKIDSSINELKKVKDEKTLLEDEKTNYVNIVREKNDEIKKMQTEYTEKVDELTKQNNDDLIKELDTLTQAKSSLESEISGYVKTIEEKVEEMKRMKRN